MPTLSNHDSTRVRLTSHTTATFTLMSQASPITISGNGSSEVLVSTCQPEDVRKVTRESTNMALSTNSGNLEALAQQFFSNDRDFSTMNIEVSLTTIAQKMDNSRLEIVSSSSSSFKITAEMALRLGDCTRDREEEVHVQACPQQPQSDLGEHSGGSSLRSSDNYVYLRKSSSRESRNERVSSVDESHTCDIVTEEAQQMVDESKISSNNSVSEKCPSELTACPPHGTCRVHLKNAIDIEKMEDCSLQCKINTKINKKLTFKTILRYLNGKIDVQNKVDPKMCKIEERMDPDHYSVNFSLNKTNNAVI